MCVLLCANSKVCDWLEIPFAIAHQQMLQLSVLCPGEPGTCGASEDLSSQSEPRDELDEVTQRRLMKRSAWLQAYFARRIQQTQRRSSPQDWHKPFELIAKACGRLLSFVGLHW